ncbi:MAG: type II secretion system protein [Planctomycetota bacterium]
MRRPDLALVRRFTLVELLVVIAVIAILVGIAIPAMSGIRSRSQRKATEAFLQRLKLAIETYSNDFGDYPPSDFGRAGFPKKHNAENEGGEVLVRCLTTSAKKGPYVELTEQELGNEDMDMLGSGNPTKSIIANQDLLEVRDVWNNAVLYLHNRDYDKGGTILVKGEPQHVSAHKHEKTGQYSGLTSFQLFSAGPDGEVGTDDDVWVAGE